MAPSNNLAAAQDFRALSLLSTNSWGSCDPETSILDHSMHTNHVSLTQPLPSIHTASLGGPLISSEFWQADQPSSGSASGSGSGSQPSTFKLFEAPNESNFYHY